MKARASQRLNILSECKELVSNYLDECSQKLFTSKMKKFTLWVQHPHPKRTPIPSPRPCGFKGHCSNYQGYFNHICNLHHYQARSGQQEQGTPSPARTPFQKGRSSIFSSWYLRMGDKLWPHLLYLQPMGDWIKQGGLNCTELENSIGIAMHLHLHHLGNM